MLCNDIKYFQRRSCPKQDKKQQCIGIKSFYSKISQGFEYKKTASVNCLLKKVHKKKTRAEMAYVYRMLFKISITYKKTFLTVRRTAVSVMKQLKSTREIRKI